MTSEESSFNENEKIALARLLIVGVGISLGELFSLYRRKNNEGNDDIVLKIYHKKFDLSVSVRCSNSEGTLTINLEIDDYIRSRSEAANDGIVVFDHSERESKSIALVQNFLGAGKECGIEVMYSDHKKVYSILLYKKILEVKESDRIHQLREICENIIAKPLRMIFDQI